MPDTRAVLAAAGTRGLRWDYGDFPYGLEPLVMPSPSHPGAAARSPIELVIAHDVERTYAALEPALEDAELPMPPSIDALYWFRWITGHQITFLLWHLMGVLVREIDAEGATDERTAGDLEAYTRGYSAMLLYSGSCPPETYHTLIRPRMYLQHRGFSGMWAADFAPLRRLLRGRTLPWLTGPGGARLADAIAANRATHEAVAARLVPDGESLLRQSAAENVVGPSARTAAIFDSFFLTLRAQVGRDAVVAQLLHRIRAVGLDLASSRLAEDGVLVGYSLRQVVRSATRDDRKTSS